MKPKFFRNSAAFRQWLEKNHATAREVWAGFHKVHTGKPSMTWSESVDQALCFGWIDGIRKSIDENSYMIRFTPRNPKSNWSAINIKKANALIKSGLMQPEGLAMFKKRAKPKSEVYSYENKPAKLSPELEKLLKARTTAWKFFKSQPPSHQRTVIYWIMAAKQESTKLRRLQKLIDASLNAKRL